MNKIAVMISLDYELFGDGTGDVQREQIVPTQHLKNIASLYNVKLTILFEYGQYLAYEKYSTVNQNFAIQNKLIENQLIDFVKDGHDVQFHFHAQWHNAVYNQKTEEFELNLEYVDFTAMDYKDMTSILYQGKKFLEDLLKPIKNDYQCIGFRSGSWAVKDEEKLYKALKECGYKADSSVVPNTKFESEQVNFEYKDCPHNYKYWMVDKKISKEAKSKKSYFVEIPPYTIKHPLAFFKYLNPKNKLSRKIMSKFYTTKISEKNFSIFQKIKKILTRNYYMADINTMDYKTLIQMVEEVIHNKTLYNKKEIIPLMFIGHPKVTYGCDDLHLFFHYMKEKYPEIVTYWTYQESIQYILGEEIK